MLVKVIAACNRRRRYPTSGAVQDGVRSRAELQRDGCQEAVLFVPAVESQQSR